MQYDFGSVVDRSVNWHKVKNFEHARSHAGLRHMRREHVKSAWSASDQGAKRGAGKECLGSPEVIGSSCGEGSGTLGARRAGSARQGRSPAQAGPP